MQLYSDVMGNYGLRLCGVFNLLCCGRWNSQFIYIMLIWLMLWSLGKDVINLLIPTKEAILIRINDPSLNRNTGKFQLPHIWDEVLVKSLELKFKYITKAHNIRAMVTPNTHMVP